MPPRARGTPNSIPYIHVNWSFPTPIIISFTSSSFLTYPYSFRCVCDDQPVSNRCYIQPAATFVVIDHDGDVSLPIHLAPETRGHHPTLWMISDTDCNRRQRLAPIRLQFSDFLSRFIVTRDCAIQTPSYTF